MLQNERSICTTNKRIAKKLQEIMGLRKDYQDLSGIQKKKSQTHKKTKSFMGPAGYNCYSKKSVYTNENLSPFSNNGTRKNNSFVVTPVSKQKPQTQKYNNSVYRDNSPLGGTNTVSSTIK